MAVAQYYFDIETEGLDPRTDKIIAATYQKISWGKPVGDLVILKEWEMGEKALIKRLLQMGVLTKGFDFLPTGYNLPFDLIFVIRRAKTQGLTNWGYDDVLDYFYNKPTLDLKPVAVTMNEGDFKTTLRTFSSKKRRGAEIPSLYGERQYSEIISYIEEEVQAFFQLYHQLTMELGKVGQTIRSALSEGVLGSPNP